MRNKMALVFTMLSSVCAGSPAVSRGYPQTEMTNGLLDVSVASDTGNPANFYRGQRFDWAGIVYSLRYRGHSYFGEWFDNFDPNFHDTVCGPAEEFTQIGYDDAKIGGGFLKIGVGVLRRSSDKPYSFRDPYEIVDGGKWSVSSTKKSITYTQTLQSELGSYVYEKTLELAENSPVMAIRHRLENTGKKAIDTSVYCHNFFMLDNEPAGKNISLKFAFEPKGAELLLGAEKFVSLRGREFVYNKNFEDGDLALYKNFDGENKLENYDFRLENAKTGAGVRITSDRPLMKVTFWSCKKTYCVEPFTRIVVEPNGVFEWTNFYEFYEK